MPCRSLDSRLTDGFMGRFNNDEYEQRGLVTRK
ncbi:hypothetical protein J3R03_008307 [Actinoplanes couchii]|nr:hypothetical protein [Actinoplanes couchii]